jgi:hypothetical protein
MQYYSNELHKKHKVAMLDMDDVFMIIMIIAIMNTLSFYFAIGLFVLFYFYLGYKKSQPRGFLMHFFYTLGLKKIEGYPNIATTQFNE